MPSGLPTVCHDQPPVCRDTERGASADLPPSDPRRHQVLVPHSTPAFLLKSASQGFSTLLSWPSTQRSWRHGRGDDIGTTTCGAGMKLTVAIDASSVFRMLVPAAADVPTSPPLQEQIGVGEGTLLVGQIYEPEEVSRNEAVEAGGRGDTIRTPAAGDRAKGGHTREGVLLIAMLGSTVAAARFLLSPLRRRCTGRSSRER